MRSLLPPLLVAALAVTTVAPSPGLSQPTKTKVKTNNGNGNGNSPSGGTTSGGTTTGGTTTGGTPSPLTTLTRQWDACGGPTVGSLLCASVRVSVTGTTTVVGVQNYSGASIFGGTQYASAGQWVLTTVGFDGIPNSTGTFTASAGASSGSWWQPAVTTSAPASWQRFDDKVFGAGVRVDFGLENGNGIANGIASSCAPAGTLPGGSNSLWMTIVEGCESGYAVANANANQGWFETSFTTAESWDPNGTDVAAFWKGQNGPGGASYECLVGGANPKGDCVDPETLNPNAAVSDSSVVPEPRTVLLMATGLIGIAVPIVRRRFRKNR